MALINSQIRINTISLVHEGLYNRDDMEEIDFQDYLNKLTAHIKSIFWTDDNPIKIDIKCEGFTPELSESVSLGMIINELCTNSFKYAFKNVDEPSISIVYANRQLIYSDNGPGFDSSTIKNTLGLKLIDVFAKQINATFYFKNENNRHLNIIDFKKIGNNEK